MNSPHNAQPGTPINPYTGGEQLDPATVLADAIAQLNADGHRQLAVELRRVDAYLRQLAVAHTEIAQVSDHVLEHGEQLLRGEIPDDPG